MVLTVKVSAMAWSGLCIRAFLTGLAVGGLGFSPAVHAANNVFCCADAEGKQACGDILPAVCHGRAYRELNSRGAVVRQVEAPLSVEEKQQRIATEHSRQKSDTAVRERQRADRALLKTYASVEEIVAWQQRAQAPLEVALTETEKQLSALRERRAQYIQEAEFYKKKPLPAELARQLQDTEREIALQQTVLAGRQKELAVLQAKYAQDKQRYIELTSKTETGSTTKLPKP